MASIAWVFKRRGILLEIYQEYGNWRRVRDWDGSTGWIHHSLLSGQRTGIVAPWSKDHLALYAKPATDSPVVAWLEPRVEVKLTRCDGQWCAVASGPSTGFTNKSDCGASTPVKSSSLVALNRRPSGFDFRRGDCGTGARLLAPSRRLPADAGRTGEPIANRG
ncbi:hypothetical protein MPLDJ20_260154 [Mesorhizobium plurifarium]|uniref:Aspartyl-trna synthetase n=1 Tax=Mesorhizobium plurifarium TaxID=69974 RepID=A0A090F7N8_MESPL|nr:hypothetical protein MPLDJ20_260154 [Mesorhizobium plurifarium]